MINCSFKFPFYVFLFFLSIVVVIYCDISLISSQNKNNNRWKYQLKLILSETVWTLGWMSLDYTMSLFCVIPIITLNPSLCMYSHYHTDKMNNKMKDRESNCPRQNGKIKIGFSMYLLRNNKSSAYTHSNWNMKKQHVTGGEYYKVFKILLFVMSHFARPNNQQ